MGRFIRIRLRHDRRTFLLLPSIFPPWNSRLSTTTTFFFFSSHKTQKQTKKFNRLVFPPLHPSFFFFPRLLSARPERRIQLSLKRATSLLCFPRRSAFGLIRPKTFPFSQMGANVPPPVSRFERICTPPRKRNGRGPFLDFLPFSPFLLRSYPLPLKSMERFSPSFFLFLLRCGKTCAFRPPYIAVALRILLLFFLPRVQRIVHFRSRQRSPPFLLDPIVLSRLTDGGFQLINGIEGMKTPLPL